MPTLPAGPGTHHCEAARRSRRLVTTLRRITEVTRSVLWIGTQRLVGTMTIFTRPPQKLIQKLIVPSEADWLTPLIQPPRHFTFHMDWRDATTNEPSLWHHVCVDASVTC